LQREVSRKSISPIYATLGEDRDPEIEGAEIGEIEDPDPETEEIEIELTGEEDHQEARDLQEEIEEMTHDLIEITDKAGEETLIEEMIEEMIEEEMTEEMIEDTGTEITIVQEDQGQSLEMPLDPEVERTSKTGLLAGIEGL